MSSVWRQLRPSLNRIQGILLASFILFAIIGVVILVPNAWIPAWQEGGVGYALFNVVLAPLGSVEHGPVYLFFLGIFLGNAALWVIDIFKRYASLVIWTPLAFAGLLWLLEWPLSFSLGSITSAVLCSIGVIIGLQLGGLPVLQRFRNSEALLPYRQSNLRFTKAVRITLLCIVALSLVGFTDQHLAIDGGISVENASWISLHLLGIALVVGPVAYFQEYEDTERVIQLGPARSGKTSIHGGLYMSLEETVVERRSNLLAQIHQEYMEQGQFPDRTEIASIAEYTSVVPVEQEDDEHEEALIVEFAYITGDALFPKEKVITTVDYPGEILTGKRGDNEGIAAYVQKHAENGTYANWDETMRALHQGEREMVHDKMKAERLKKHLASLVHSAEVIMFTLPLDDFVAPIVADDTRRDNIPGYHRDKIFIIEEDDGEAEYRVKRLTGSEWYELDEKGGDLRPKDSNLNGNELEGFVAEEDKWRGSDGFYIYRTTRPRRSPQVYLLEYKRILEYLPKLSNHDFIWLTSMADLVLDDFKDVADDTRGYKTAETSGESDESIRFNEETSEIKVGRSDINPEMIKDLFNIDKDWSPRLRSNVSEYRVFSEWVKQEYLFAEEPKLKKWMEDKTKENYVFPVWFDIDDEGENRFSTQSPEVLNGSQYLTDRLRGDHLGRHYPNGRLGQVRERLPFTDTEGYPSKSEMAYRVLRHRRHSGE